MNKCIPAMLCLFLLSESFAQNPVASSPSSFGSFPAHYSPASFKTVTIELTKPGKSAAGGGRFNHFECLDARPDTTFIGVHTENLLLPMTRLRQLVLKGPLGTMLPGYLNAYAANPGNPYTVLVVIRKCWISDVTYSYHDRESRVEMDVRDEKVHIRLKAEIYVSRNPENESDPAGKGLHYTPLLRYDSLLDLNKAGYDRVGNALSGLLQNMADTLSRLDIDKKWETGRTLSRADIDRFSSLAFDFPIFRDSILAKGVYADFDEFRNNAPSVSDYEIVTENNRSSLYIRDPSGHTYYNHSAWGVCDGKNLYVMLEGSLYTLFRMQHAFYLSGFIEAKGIPEENGEEMEKYSNPANELAGAPLDPKNGPTQNNRNAGRRQTRVFAVDPDTGILY